MIPAPPIRVPLLISEGGFLFVNRVRQWSDWFIKASEAINAMSESVTSKTFYFGDSETDGTWRIQPAGTDLVFQRREAGVWVTKGTFAA